ncbi:peptidoglycan D,D-transpeptidase FtsI family protein [Cohnella mopanensis]|uniref:peptidoglycan D,D-transpeptidase FtsI family protein n=1 Tax=Cohnella mopanensis TaxID=2911966 RepID=UPI001EF8D988
MSNNQSEEAQKREIRNRRHFSFRLNVFFFITFFVFSILIVRLAYLQFVEGDNLRAKEHEIATRPVAVPPIRGNIYDSEGVALAYSTSTQSLYFTFDTKMTEEKGLALAERLVEVFDRLGQKTAKPLTAKEVLADMDLKGKVYFSYQPRRIKSGLTKEEIAFFSEHKKEFPGMDVVEESIRQYNKEKVAVQLVGYMKKMSGAASLEKYKDINKDNTDKTLEYLKSEEVGFDGLEYMFQDELRGLNGIKEYPVNNQSEIIGPMKLTKPVKGENIYLTINKDIQLDTQRAITEHLAKIRSSTNKQESAKNAKTGYAVAMEVKTGKVVAMASMPDYDPEVWQGGISSEDLDSIKYYMSNGAIRDVQPPYNDDKERMKHPSSLVNLGSTQKPLTILLGLNEKLITTQSEFIDPGYFAFGREGHETRVRNASSAANGKLKPATAIAKSSNAFMASMVGNRLYMRDGTQGVDIWDSYMKQFGLGVTTGSGLPHESSGSINYFKEVKNGSAQSALIYASFGQQARYSVLQLAQYASTLASHGQRMRPQFINKIVDSDGKIIQSFQSEILNTVSFPEAYWNTIETGMSQVRVQGFEDFKYNFYRKTGTSEQDVGGGRVENAVFIAYAPAENPTLAVAVVVPEGGYGGWGAAPIARKIFDSYDEYVGLNGTPQKKEVTAPPVNGAADGVPDGQAADQQ